MAGLISDYTNGRATTCCIMLILAAPMVCMTSRASVPLWLCGPPRCAHLGMYADARLCVCVHHSAQPGEETGKRLAQERGQTGTLGKGY